MPPLWAADFSGVLVDMAEEDVEVIDGHRRVVGFAGGDGFADEGFSDKDEAACPPDVAIGAYAPDGVVLSVDRFAQAAVIGAVRRGVEPRGRALLQSFMRAFVVEFVPESVEPSLLGGNGG